MLKEIQISRAAGLDGLSGHFLKDGEIIIIIAKIINDLSNLLINFKKIS